MEFCPNALISFVLALDFAYSHNESIIQKKKKQNMGKK